MTLAPENPRICHFQIVQEVSWQQHSSDLLLGAPRPESGEVSLLMLDTLLWPAGGTLRLLSFQSRLLHHGLVDRPAGLAAVFVGLRRSRRREISRAVVSRNCEFVSTSLRYEPVGCARGCGCGCGFEQES